MNQNMTGSEQQPYKLFYEKYPDAIILLKDGIIVTYNQYAQKLLQINKEADFLGKKLSYFTDKEFEENIKREDTLEKYLHTCNVEGEFSFEWRIQDIKGKVVDTRIIFTKVEIEQQVFTQVIIRDNTEQKQLERKYKALEKEGNEQLLMITEALDQSAIVSIADKGGKIIKVNEEFCFISQYSEKELLGKNHNIINSGHHPKEFWQDMWQTVTTGKTWRADVKNKAKDGSFYWVDTVINPMLDSEGKIMSYLSIRYLITDRKKIEFELQTRQEQLQATEEELRQNLEELEAQRDYIQEVNKEIKDKSDISDRNSRVLLELNKSNDIHIGNLDTAFEFITKKVATVLKIERVGIWKYETSNEVKIISQKQYEITQNGHVFTKDTEIKQKDTPIYFADLVAERNIVADSAQNHPTLVEFVDSYLIPLQINSMLDIPYLVDGKFAGIICCETQGQYKNWTDEDISFVKGIADIITITIKTQQQLEEQEKVKQNEKLLFRFLDRIPAGIVIIDTDGSPFFANDIAKKLLGEIVPLEDGQNIASSYPVKIAGTDEDYPQEKLPLILALQGKEIHVEDMEIMNGLQRIPLEANASPIQSDNGDIEYSISIFQDITERKAKELEIKKKNEELATTEEELRQNMEELQTTQEAMREKQVLIEQAKVSLERQNSKLAANESVLRKTFYKMKAQEVQLKESFDALQTQEEELRQSMEELEATQEAMREKQVVVEEAKIALEKQNDRLASNEGVLKKAFQKMKVQDLKLRESFDVLQTQEEELRQNMEELQTTQEVLAYQKDILEVSNRQTNKSISYAETIQKAILPSQKLIKETLPESFIIYKPKDIVSGDFYWLSRHTDKTIDKTLLGVIDCTGHGVPGAFMSLIASNILSEIINQKGILQPNLILHELHNGVVKKLNQKEGANNDGMDLTLCLIEKISNEQTQLTFAGVKQNLYIVRNKELIELKSNRRSIGGGRRDDERKYTQENIMLQKNDSVFLVTDGYSDQANEERKSFSKRRFRELMIEVGDLSAQEQKNILENRLAQHQQETEQRDDITVFGFKI
jgi:PAS domain S-box-containing protein